ADGDAFLEGRRVVELSAGDVQVRSAAGLADQPLVRHAVAHLGDVVDHVIIEDPLWGGGRDAVGVAKTAHAAAGRHVVRDGDGPGLAAGTAVIATVVTGDVLGGPGVPVGLLSTLGRGRATVDGQRGGGGVHGRVCAVRVVRRVVEREGQAGGG